MKPRVIESVERIYNNADFQVFVAHLEDTLKIATTQLLIAPAEGIILAQGRAQMVEHILTEIRNVKKQTTT